MSFCLQADVYLAILYHYHGSYMADWGLFLFNWGVKPIDDPWGSSANRD